MSWCCDSDINELKIKHDSVVGCMRRKNENGEQNMPKKGSKKEGTRTAR